MPNSSLLTALARSRLTKNTTKSKAKESSGLTKKQGHINGSFLTALALLHPFT